MYTPYVFKCILNGAFTFYLQHSFIQVLIIQLLRMCWIVSLCRAKKPKTFENKMDSIYNSND